MSSHHVYENFIVSQKAIARCPNEFEPFHIRYGSFRPRLHFLADTTGGCCESFHVDTGLVMLVMNVGLAGNTAVQLRGQDILEFHYRLAGALEMRGGWGSLQMEEPTLLLWRQPLGCDDVDEVIGHAKSRETSISLYCDPQWLASQMGEQGSTALLDFLGGSPSGQACAPIYRRCTLFDQTHDILHDIVRNPFQGPMRYLYAKGKALELLCRTVQLLAAQDSPRRLPVRLRDRDRRSILMAYEILKKEYAAAPDLKRLARRVGVNTTKLCTEFKNEFGDTVTACVRKIRLERARELLVSSGLPIGQIALSVGYKHHSTFTAAFTEHFGVAPRARRER